MRTWLLTIVTLCCLLFLACSNTPPTATPVPFTNITFKVPAGESYNMPLDLQAGDRLEFGFESDLDIRFAIHGPNNTTIRDFGRIEVLGTHTLTAETAGRHTLFFDNGFSLFTSKTIIILYRVVPPGGR